MLANVDFDIDISSVNVYIADFCLRFFNLSSVDCFILDLSV